MGTASELMGDDGDDGMNGLSIDKKTFMKMNVKQQNCILFSNQVITLKEIKKYRFHQRVNTVIMMIGIIGIGILFKMHLPG